MSGVLAHWQNFSERPGAVPDAKGVAHTSPGQRPGLVAPILFPALKARFIYMKQAVGLHWIQIALEPRALPWAGMNQAFGL
jgi:hypothetical protein